MSTTDAWDLWGGIILEWVNELHLKKHHQLSFEDLSNGKIFEKIIKNVLKVNVRPTSTENDSIKSFLQTEYPDIQLNLSSSKNDLLLASLLLHYWSMRLCESEYNARDRVCARLRGETEKAIRNFLEKLMPNETIHITNEQLTQSIKSLKPCSTEVIFPSTPCSKAPSRCHGSLGKFLNSPVAKQQKVLAECQQKLRAALSELDQEQLEKSALEKELVFSASKSRKLEAQLKEAMVDIAQLEDRVLTLRDDTSAIHCDRQIKILKEEIKSLNKDIVELQSTYQPVEEEKIKLEARCVKLEEALKLLTDSSKDQEIFIMDLSQQIQEKDKHLEELTNNNQEWEAYFKGMRNVGNESSDFDTSLSGYLQIPGSPKPVLDTLPLSSTVVDIQLQDKLAELSNLKNQIDAAAKKISNILSKCNHDSSFGGVMLNNLESLENIFEQNKQDLVDLRDELTKMNKEIADMEEERNLLSSSLAESQTAEKELNESFQKIKIELANAVYTQELCSKENDKKIDQLETSIAEKNTEIDTLTVKHTLLVQEFDDLNKLLVEEQNKVHKISEECGGLRTRLDIVIEERNTLQEDFCSQEAETLKSHAEAESLKLRCDDYEAKIVCMSGNITKMNKEIADMEEQQNLLSSSLAESQTAEKDLKESFQKMKIELANAVYTQELCSKENDKKIDQLETSIAEKNTEIDTLTVKHTLLVQEFDDLNKLLVEEQNKVHKISEECGGLRTRLDIVIEERNTLQEDFCSQEAETLKSHAEAESLKLRCDDYEAKIADMSGNITKMNKEIADMEEQRNLLSSSLAESQTAEKDLKESFQKMKIELANAVYTQELCSKENVERTEQLETSIAEKNTEIDTVTVKHTLLVQEFDDLNKLLVEEQNKVHKISEECGGLRTRLDIVIEERNTLQEDFCSQEAETLKSHAEAESLKLRCDDYEAKIVGMSGNITKMNKEIADMEEQRNLLSSSLAESQTAEKDLKESFQKMKIELANAVYTQELCSKENVERTEQLETSIAEKNTEIDTLTVQHTLLVQEFDDLNKLLVEEQNKVHKISEECGGLRTRLDIVIEERNTLQEDFCSQEAETLKSHAEAESLKLRCDDYEAKIADMSGNITKMNKEIADMEEQRNLLSSSLAESQTAEKELNESFQKMKIELANAVDTQELCSKENVEKTGQLETSIAEKNTEIDTLTVKHTLLVQEFDDLNKLLVEEQNKVHKISEECGGLRTRLDIVIEERNTLQEDFCSQEAETLKSHAEAESLKLRCDDYEAEIADMNRSIVQKSNEIAGMEEQRNLLSSSLAESRMAENDLKESFQKMKIELAYAVDTRELCSKENDKKTEQLETSIVNKNTEIEILSGKHALILQELEYAQQRSAVQESQIDKSIEECGDLSSRLQVVIEERNKLTDDLRTLQSEFVESQAKIESLVLRCAENDAKLTVFARTEAETNEQLSELTRKHSNLLQEFDDINQQMSEKKMEVADLNNLVLNFEDERNSFLAEKTAASAKFSVIANEVECLKEENSLLIGKIEISNSFCNKFTLQMSDILSLDSETESDNSNVFEGSPYHAGYLKLEGLISRIKIKCHKYRCSISETNLSVEQMESTWTSEFLRLKEELSSGDEREKSVLASNLALEERVKAVEENVSDECKTLNFQIGELIKFIDCADNSVLVKSSALSAPQPPVVNGFQHVQAKLSQLRDSISLLASNKSCLFDDFCHVKEQLKEKVEEWQLLMSQVDALILSCDELKAENLKLHSLLIDVENARHESQTENNNLMLKYVLIDEKVVKLEHTLGALNSGSNFLKMQAQALQSRNAELLAELSKKTKCCLDWETVCYEISNFKKAVGKKMEHLVLCKNQIDGQLSDIRRTYDHLNSCDLVDTANLKSIDSLKFEICNRLSSLEEKHNAASLDALNCVYTSLCYPYLLIQRQLSSIGGEDISTNPSVNLCADDISVQFEHVKSAWETMLHEMGEIPMKIKELQDNCLVETASTTDVSLFDDSLEENQAEFLASQKSEPQAAFRARLFGLGDNSTVAIQNVVDSIVVSQNRQFQTLVTLKKEYYTRDKKNKLDCMALFEALKCKEKLEEKITEQQKSASKLKESYNTLLQDCEHALSDANEFRELFVGREQEIQSEQIKTKQLEEQTKQLEDQLKSCYTEAQFEQKVNKVGIEYEEKLAKMKAKMRDLFRTETAKFDKVKALACAETEKLCKSESDNQFKKYKMYVKEQTLEIDHLKEKLQQEKIENSVLSKQMIRLENRLDARNNAVHPDPLVMKRDSVMEHLQRREAVRTHIASSTTVEQEINAGSYRRQSICTRQSVTSLIPSESFAAEDEEGEVFNNTYLGDLKAGEVNLPPTLMGTERIGELQYRNSLCLPHLKSSYPAETQFHDPHSFRDEDVKLGFVSDADHSDTASLSALLLPGERQRKRDRGKNQTSYQKPGPPTPIKNGGRRSLQGGELLSPRAALREINDGARAKVSTPNRIRQLFSTKTKRDENSPMTPRGRRLSLFRKSARGREDC